MFPRPSVRHLGWLAAVLLAGGTATLVFAQTPPSDPTAGLSPVRAWDLTANLRTAFGYKENVLLSAVHVEDSAFAQAEAEIFWWRLPTERFEALAFANGRFTRFLSSATNPHEWQAFAHAEARWFVAPAVQATGVVEGYHLDQVFDLSATDAERLTAQLAVTGGLASAVWRWDLRPDTWLELKPTAQRDRYRDGSDDNVQRIARATIGRAFFTRRLELTLAAQSLRRTYERRTQYTAAGRPLPGTGLVFRQHEVEARARVVWDRTERWSTTTTVAVGDNDDNGSGFFDYHHRYARQELAWTRTPWAVRLAGRAGRYDYDVQTEGIGINPPRRLKEEFLAQARVERRSTPQAQLYAEFVWERSRSNDPLATYRVRTLTAGVDWAF